MKRADRKKDWAIKTRVDKLFDQITFRSNVVYIYLSFIHSFLWYVYQRLGLSEFFFVLCLHFWYYIIGKSCNVSPRFVRISVFSHFFDVFIQVVSHQKDFSMVRDEKLHDLYTQKIGYDLLIFGKMIICTTFDLYLVTSYIPCQSFIEFTVLFKYLK